MRCYKQIKNTDQYIQKRILECEGYVIYKEGEYDKAENLLVRAKKILSERSNNDLILECLKNIKFFLEKQEANRLYESKEVKFYQKFRQVYPLTLH